MKAVLQSILSSLPYRYRPNNLRVLAYHTVPDRSKFRRQLEYLQKNYNIISINDLKAHLFNNEPLIENPILITFDDGDYTVFKNGLPLLHELKIPSVLFIITGLINTEQTFWCRWVEEVLQDQGSTYEEARIQVRKLKTMPNYERIQYLNSLPEVKSRQLSYEELRLCTNAGMYIANHTHNHPMLDNCEKQEIIQEFELAEDFFQKHGLDGFSVFAYPNGNFTIEAEEVLIEKQIEMAFLFDHQINKDKINPFRISRIMADTDLALDEFKIRVSGLHSKMLKLKRSLSK